MRNNSKDDLPLVFHIITRMDMGGSAQNTLISCSKLSLFYKIILGYGPTSESVMTLSERSAVESGIQDAICKGVKPIEIRHLYRRMNPYFDFLALLEILIISFKTRPDIIHTHSSKAGLLGRFAALLTRTPIIIHSPHGHVFYGHFGRLSSKFFLIIEKLMGRCTDVTIALTQGELEDYVALRVAPYSKLTKIHSGVEVERFIVKPYRNGEKRLALGIKPYAKVVGTVGWLLPIKGPDILIKAMGFLWKDCPDAHLVFVGKGAMIDELKNMAIESGKENRVHFLGWREDIWNILPLFDIFVLPSRNEGMGRVIVEAMAAGKPIVASNVGGIPDLVEDGVNGILFPPEDVHALYSALRSLIEDPEKAQLMGQKGRVKCKDYSIRAMIDKLDKLYRRLISQKQIRRKL